MKENKILESVKEDNLVIKKLVYGILFYGAILGGIIGSCDFFMRKFGKDTIDVSQIQPTKVTLDNQFYPSTLETDLVFKGFGEQDGKNFEVIFVDHGLNGSLDYIVLQNSSGRDSLYISSPYFSEWNQKFLDMRERRFGDKQK